MPASLFEHSQFLQAVGWGILHSFWQTAMLWILYRILTAGNQITSSSFRYNLGIFSLLLSLLGFIFTVANQYSAIRSGQALPVNLLVFNFKTVPEFNQYVLPATSFIYFLLLGFYLVQFLGQYLSLYNIRNAKLVKAPVDIRLFAEQMAFRMGIKKNVTCWLSAKVDAPFVTGFFKPVILLPFSLLNHLTTAQAEAVILHELAHVKRNDYLVNIFQLIAEKLLFFNPFARLLSEAVKVEREHCCDDFVLQFRFNQHEYAHALLQVEQLRNQQLMFAMNATSGKKKLLERIKRIVSAQPVPAVTGWQKTRLAASALGFASVLLFLAPVTKVAVTPAAVATVYTSSSDIPVLRYQPAEPLTKSLPIKPYKELEIIPDVKESTSKAEKQLDEDEPSSTMLINEQLLETPVEPAVAAIQVNNQPHSKPAMLMVRVEEEVGGSSEKKVYYLQLDNTNGETAITPLALVKQPVTDSVKNLTDATKQLRSKSKKMVAKKLRTI